MQNVRISHMKKIFSLLLALTFAAYPVSGMAAQAVNLSDTEMDEIAAGEWALEPEVAFYQNQSNSTKKNVLKVEDNSQSEITGVSNANAVDSAVAVQSNISNQTEGLLDVNQSNGATVENHSQTETTTIKEYIKADLTTSKEYKEENLNTTTHKTSSTTANKDTYKDVSFTDKDSSTASSNSSSQSSASSDKNTYKKNTS